MEGGLWVIVSGRGLSNFYNKFIDFVLRNVIIRVRVFILFVEIIV